MTACDGVPATLIIVGAGGHGSELQAYVEDLGAAGIPVRLAGFIDDARPAGAWGKATVIGALDDLRDYVSAHTPMQLLYITAVGDNTLRRQLVDRVERLGVPTLRAWRLVHPRATVGQDVTIGVGTCLAPGSILTTRVQIGRHCIVNVNASVSHDSVVGDFTNLNPGAVICGNVRLGEGCYVGAGATVIENRTVGAGTIIGAGAVVTRDLPSGVTAVGVPAQVLIRNRSGAT